MIPLLVGAAVLFVLIAGARGFERASVKTIKALLAWIAALGGLTLALMLILTGRAGAAIGALLLFGPLIYQHWMAARGGGSRPSGFGQNGPGGGATGNRGAGKGAGWAGFRPSPKGGMSRAEAYEILGLAPGASEAAIKEAHHRLMRAAHPDAGGSDWLASRINQARDVLLG